ncbi:MAG: DMT family transporter [Kiritimatiellales bacterium]
MWIYLGLVSALLLGSYDVCQKHALNKNAVLPVLLFSVCTGAVLMLLIFALSRLAPETMQQHCCYVPPATRSEHLHIFFKSCIVCVSWVLTYFSMKHLPISIAAPIRASSPVWTLLCAVLFFGERPDPAQWTGMLVVFISYYIFSVAGRKEGVVFHRNGWVLLIFTATLIGAGSVLYDKYLLQQLRYTPMLVQFWFSVYNAILIAGVVAIAWWPRREKLTKFRWRWTIPLIGLFLLVSDFAYFNAIREPDALASVLSVVRRTGVIVSFTSGALLFGETNIRRKIIALAGILAGVILIILF